MSESREKPKIYVVGSSTHYANWMEGTLVPTVEEADIVVFTGGEDVDPLMYKQERNPKTSSNISRDLEEEKIFLQAKELNKKMVGICRGSQFLCVMAGGTLVQHQENPLYVHDLITYTGDDVETTSTHHQAQNPYGLMPRDYQILAWTSGISPMHENGRKQELYVPGMKECEVVYYDKINALGIQGHPESMYDNPRFNSSMRWFQSVFNKFRFGVYKHSCALKHKQTV